MKDRCVRLISSESIFGLSNFVKDSSIFQVRIDLLTLDPVILVQKDNAEDFLLDIVNFQEVACQDFVIFSTSNSKATIETHIVVRTGRKERLVFDVFEIFMYSCHHKAIYTCVQFSQWCS